MCAPIKQFFFFCKKPLLMLFQTCTKLTFGLSDVFAVTVIARNGINGVGSLFFRDRILRFGKNMPRSLERVLSNFNVVSIQNSLDGFRNTLNVRNNSKINRWFPFIRSATSRDWFLVVTEKSFCIAIRLLDIRNIFPLLSLRIEWRWKKVSPSE